MGDFVETEEILAEPEETGGIFNFIQSTFANAHLLIASNGWYIIAGGIACYYLWRHYAKDLFPQNQNINTKPQSPEEVSAFLTKEEQRKLAIEKLQEKYLIDAQIREEKMKKLEEEKKKARMAELKKLEERGLGAGPGGQRLGGESSKKSFKPEYNPLMGDTSSRVCFRRPGGGSGGA